MSAFWVGARKLASPALSGVGVGNMSSHIIAQDSLLIQKHDMTWYNFKEAVPAKKIIKTPSPLK